MAAEMLFSPRSNVEKEMDYFILTFQTIKIEMALVAGRYLIKIVLKYRVN